MFDTLIAFALACLADQHDVDSLQRFAPRYLTAETAREHLGAAQLAGERFAVDPTILLAIAFNESRFIANVDGAEADGTRACGLTGVNRVRCDPTELTVLDGYLDGAEILRNWIDEAERPRHPRAIECRRQSSVWQCAMMGYAGGWNAIGICNTREHPDCGYPAVVMRRAAKIKGKV
jgi:hypothetical protein